ncbi:MAG: hypothetical protein K0Q55_357 [Verrucomicrobia bacterium]|nr:hypothetical protein [Verrucomicrobiota bacterium]
MGIQAAMKFAQIQRQREPDTAGQQIWVGRFTGGQFPQEYQNRRWHPPPERHLGINHTGPYDQQTIVLGLLRGRGGGVSVMADRKAAHPYSVSEHLAQQGITGPDPHDEGGTHIGA